MRVIAVAGIVAGLSLGAAGSAGAAVLHQQIPTGSFSSESPESHDTADAMGSVAADDFSIGDGQVWRIQEVEVHGSADPGGAHTATVGLYGGGAAPGPSLFSQSGIPIPRCAGPPAECNFTASLGGAPALGPGHYWVSVQTRGEATWFWSVHPPTQLYGRPAVWQNPGNGYADHGCTVFKPLVECGIGDASGGRDLVFALTGELTDSRFSVQQMTARGLRLFARVNVPGAGTMAIGGRGVKLSTKAVPPGEQRLRVRLKASVLERLRSGRNARVRVRLTFTATGGDPYTQRTKAKLVPVGRAAVRLAF